MIGDTIFIGNYAPKVFTDNELIAICLHEYGHVHNKHTYERLCSESIYASILIIAASMFIGTNVYAVWQKKIKTRHLPVTLTLSAILLGLLYFRLKMVRRDEMFYHEYQADNFTYRLGYGEELSSVLKKFKKISKKEVPPRTVMQRVNRWFADFEKTHPDLSDRIKRLAVTKL